MVLEISETKHNNYTFHVTTIPYYVSMTTNVVPTEAVKI